MANPTWASTGLPNPNYNQGGYDAPTNDIITSTVDVGIPKTRRRTTTSAEPFTCQLTLTDAQVATLKTFYKTTVSKVLPFDWTDFRDQSTCTYKFMKAPQYLPIGYNNWTVTLNLLRIAP